MGLDTVELVLAIEDEFSISIPDDEAEKMETVGDIYEYVRKAFHLKPRPAPPDEEIWRRVRHVVIEQLGVEERRVTKEARVVQDLGAD